MDGAGITTQIKLPSEETCFKAKGMRDRCKGQEYTLVNNADHVPEVCNEFVTVYIFENKQIVLSKSDAIDFTMNLCHWLFEQTFTVSRISMIKTA